MAKRKQSDPSDPAINPFTVVIDNSEQLPWQFQSLKTDEPPSRRHLSRPLVVPTIWKSINTADYSIEGFENQIVIERKSHADAAATFTRDRERFERELERMQDIASNGGFAAVLGNLQLGQSTQRILVHASHQGCDWVALVLGRVCASLPSGLGQNG